MKLAAAFALVCLLVAGVGSAYAHERPSRGAATHGIVLDGLTRAKPGGPCKTGFQFALPHGRLGCTHGPDPGPPGRDVTAPRSLEEIVLLQGDPRVLLDTAPLSSVPCLGDGVDGNRVQAVYAYPADGDDNYAAVAPYIRSWAAMMDRDVNDSAAKTGGTRHIRFVTGADCELDIAKLALSPSGLESLPGTTADLAAQGLDRTDRKYVVWVDAYVYCGIASMKVDDRASQANPNNGDGEMGMVARIDRGCWGISQSSAEVHELVHILGGVQPTAPNATDYHHCTDNADVMCYDDDGYADGLVWANGEQVPLRQVCGLTQERLLDCNDDDYFAANPSPQSWLAQHWNVADSSFLTSEGPPAPPDTTAPTPTKPRTIVEGRLGRRVTVRLTWSSRDPDVAGYWLWKSRDGRRWRYVPRADLWSNTAVVRVLRGHSYRFLVHAFDQAGNASRAAIGRRFSARVFQERNPAVSYEGRWSRLYRPAASADHVSVARSGPVRSRFAFYGKGIAWVAPTSTEGGSAAVFVDGRFVRTVHLTSTEPRERQVVFSHRFARLRWHRIVVRPREGPAEVPVDAFVVLRR